MAAPWTVNIGFHDVPSAEKVQKFLHQNGHCGASLIRVSKRCLGWKYELKIWLLSQKVLNTLIAKENERVNNERKTQVSVQDLTKLPDVKLREVAADKGIDPTQPRFKLLQELGVKPPERKEALPLFSPFAPRRRIKDDL
jgi:hypothetical protein